MANLKFTGQTGEKLKIQLPSRIVYARWRGSATSAGGVITIDVLTQWCANNSDIKITVKDGDGKKVDTFEGKVWNNRYRKEYVPEPNNTQSLQFEAVMKAHKLDAVSDVMRVFPTVTIENMQFQNAEGDVLDCISKEDELTLSSEVKGPPDGTKAIVTLHCKLSEGETKFIFSTETKTVNGKAEIPWANDFPIEEEKIKTSSDLERDGEDYFNPVYYFTVECYATKVKSDDVPYKSWASFSINAPGKTAVFHLPDGSEQEVPIPEDGLVKVENPTVGKISFKEIRD